MAGKILRRHQVEQTIGLSRSTLYTMMAEGIFPKPVKLGKRAVGWRASDVAAWLESREESALEIHTPNVSSQKHRPDGATPAHLSKGRRADR
jgi:prophage regulatory protein